MTFPPLSLRAKFLLIVLLGAVVPLGLVGVWLTGSAARSGRALLHAELDTALTTMAADARRRWSLRDGELRLLANNSVVRAALADPRSAPLSRGDSDYLNQLAGGLGSAIASVSYYDAMGRTRWSFPTGNDLGRSIPRAAAERVSPLGARTFPVRLPVVADGREVGSLRASVRLSGVLPADVGAPGVAGAALIVANAQGELLSTAPETVRVTSRSAPAGWEIETRTLRGPPLRLTLAAPSAPFVRPFALAARLGLGVLMVVALVALIVSALLTTHLTRSLERLAIAADAIAAGDLHAAVEVGGRDEIGRLAAAFNAMAESLRRTLAELSRQQALAAVGEFAASLSHEVRNALTAIRVDLQHATFHVPSDNAGTPLVGRALGAVRRLDTAVTGALRVARSGLTPAARVDLCATVARAVQGAQPAFAANSATLEPLPPLDGELPVEGDPVALEQLFLNLLLNAGQALRPGGVARVAVELAGAQVAVSISDTGPGIAPSELPLLGEPFRSSKPEGTGLGLSIARRIAADHGGELRITSAVGAGTTVVVTLPLGAPAACATTAAR